MRRAVVVEHEPSGLEREAAVEPGRGLFVRGVVELHRLQVAGVDLHTLVDVLRKVDELHRLLLVHDDAGGDVQVFSGD